MGPDATTLYGRMRTIRTIWTTPEVRALQSDTAFSEGYEKRPSELGKLMLYQLSYSRSQAKKIPRGRVAMVFGHARTVDEWYRLRMLVSPSVG
jgi:hypothetical protein